MTEDFLPGKIEIPKHAKELIITLDPYSLCQGTALLNGRIVADKRNIAPWDAPRVPKITKILVSDFPNYKTPPNGPGYPQTGLWLSIVFTQFRGPDQGIEVEGSVQFDNGPRHGFKYLRPQNPVDPGLTHLTVTALVP